MWYKIFVESRAPRGSQQRFWFYISAKRCIVVELSNLLHFSLKLMHQIFVASGLGYFQPMLQSTLQVKAMNLIQLGLLFFLAERCRGMLRSRLPHWTASQNGSVLRPAVGYTPILESLNGLGNWDMARVGQLVAVAPVGSHHRRSCHFHWNGFLFVAIAAIDQSHSTSRGLSILRRKNVQIQKLGLSESLKIKREAIKKPSPGISVFYATVLCLSGEFKKIDIPSGGLSCRCLPAVKRPAPYLASDESKFVTGTELGIDGGHIAR
jgi:hypothetical protein